MQLNYMAAIRLSLYKTRRKEDGDATVAYLDHLVLPLGTSRLHDVEPLQVRADRLLSAQVPFK